LAPCKSTYENGMVHGRFQHITIRRLISEIYPTDKGWCVQIISVSISEFMCNCEPTARTANSAAGVFAT